MHMPTDTRALYRALIIEDDHIDYVCIEHAIHSDDQLYEADHVQTIDEAIQQLTNNSYHIIVTDMNLPDSHGLDTITTLLEIPHKTPIVVLSNTNDDAVALEAILAGAQDYIPKCYLEDKALFQRTLRHAIERHQLKLRLEAGRDRERFLAHYDQCTSLPNRILLLDRLQQSVAQANRDKERFSTFFIDLDHFKAINDSLGHCAGDVVLKCIADRIRQLLRESDTIARFGGDEFVVILHQSGEPEQAEVVADKLIQAIRQPIAYGHNLSQISASIGIACYPEHANTPDDLLRYADMAMYEAKQTGRNQVRFFNEQLLKQKNSTLSVEKALKRALDDPDAYFELHYQPRIDLATGDADSVEALIRWPSATFHTGKFIQHAEELGLIEYIDKWVLQTACKQIVDWQKQGLHSRIAVNISGQSFNRRRFVDKFILPLLEQYDISGSDLELEITEGVLLEDNDQVHEQLMSLRKLGIMISIDDFGTGFSSLSYLSHFPIDMLKIDGRFICDETGSPKEQALLKAIVALGKALDLKVVAECIETESQMEYLKTLGCDKGQGYYWGKPQKDWAPKRMKSDLALIHHQKKSNPSRPGQFL